MHAHCLAAIDETAIDETAIDPPETSPLSAITRRINLLHFLSIYSRLSESSTIKINCVRNHQKKSTRTRIATSQLIRRDIFSFSQQYGFDFQSFCRLVESAAGNPTYSRRNGRHGCAYPTATR
jgi:hypothetical protein